MTTSRSSFDRLADEVLVQNLKKVAQETFRGLKTDPAVQGLLDELRQAMVDAVARLEANGVPDPAGIDEPAPKPHYPNVGEFVGDFLLRHWRRGDRNPRWCTRWWLHEEGISRLEGLWQAWETLRLDGTTGIAIWWRDYADPTMAALTGENGTFADCVDGHKDHPMWPSEPPPAGMFRDHDHPEEQ